jgi:hypothetical protein
MIGRIIMMNEYNITLKGGRVSDPGTTLDPGNESVTLPQDVLKNVLISSQINFVRITEFVD